MVQELITGVIILVSCIGVVQGAERLKSDVAAPTRVISDSQVIFSAEMVPKLLEQCSRPVPKSDGFWTPSKEDVARLSELLPKSINSQSYRQCPNLDKNLQKFKFQYAGIVVKGRKIIYVNALSVNDETNFWQREFVGICDGGCMAWGIEFDVEIGSFSNFEANGEA